MIMRRDEREGISKVLRYERGRPFLRRERDISVITEKVLRQDAVPLFVVGAWHVGKSALARSLYDRWQNSKKRLIVPVRFSLIDDLELYGEKAGTLLEQFSKKVISCCGGGGEAKCANGEAVGTSLDRAEDAVRGVCGKRKKVVILIDDWMAICDKCKELDLRAFGDFLNKGITRLRGAGANFVFLDKVPRDLLPENISLKLPIGEEYFLLPVAYQDVKEEARKLKVKLEQRDHRLWEYVGGDFDLVRLLCRKWKDSDALSDDERGIIDCTMAGRIIRLTMLGVDSPADAHLLFRSLAKDARQVADNPVVKQLCRMGVIDPSGGGIWMCDAMRDYLERKRKQASDAPAKPIVSLKCKGMEVRIGGRSLALQRDEKQQVVQFLILYVIFSEREKFGSISYHDYKQTIENKVKGKLEDQLFLKQKMPRACAIIGPERFIVTWRDQIKEAGKALQQQFEKELKVLGIQNCVVVPRGRSGRYKTQPKDPSNWINILHVEIKDD
jgi:hypothetical protein